MRLTLKIVSIVLAVAIIGSGAFIGVTKGEECNYFFSSMHNAAVSLKNGSWLDDVNGTGDESSSDSAVSFVSGEFGGVKFDSQEDVVNYYVEAYDKTKAETANYIDKDGNTKEFYALIGDENITINSVLVDGKDNSLINKLVPTIVDSLFGASAYGLPPCTNRDPLLDLDENNESLALSRLTIDDVEACSVADNGDGTITLTIVPKAVQMSHRGLDAQGHMFNSLGAIDETVDSISVLSWSSGTTSENCVVDYENGTAVVTIDTATGKITEADYKMNVTVNVYHANVSVISDKSATLDITYDQHFPASDEYLQTSKGITRV